MCGLATLYSGVAFLICVLFLLIVATVCVCRGSWCRLFVSFDSGFACLLVASCLFVSVCDGCWWAGDMTLKRVRCFVAGFRLVCS